MSSMSSTSSIASSVSSNVFDRAAKLRDDGPPTTVMFKNLPEDYTREQVLELLNSAGFQSCYDIVSLPIDLKSEAPLGYAFINFATHEQAEQVKERFHGFKDWPEPSDKVCEALWSDNLQGYDAHIDRYRNSPVMHESVADKFKPALYKNGVRVPFPKPTKTISAPRPRVRNRGCHVGTEVSNKEGKTVGEVDAEVQ